MCEPVTLTALAVGAASAGSAAALGVAGTTALMLGATAASVVAGGIGAYNSSQAAKQQYKYQSQVARNNAIMAERAAQDASNRGGEEAARIAAQANRVRSRQIAAAAGSGIDLTSNSVQAQLEDTMLLSEMDRRQAMTNAARQAWGYRVEGSNFNASSDMYRTAAGNQNPGQAVGMSILSNAPQIMSAAGGLRAPGGNGLGSVANTPGGITSSTLNTRVPGPNLFAYA